MSPPTGSDATAITRAILLGIPYPPPGVADTPENKWLWDETAKALDAMPGGMIADIPGDWADWPDEDPPLPPAGPGEGPPPKASEPPGPAAAGWDEHKHPRVPGGPGGGRFTRTTGLAGWAKDTPRLARLVQDTAEALFIDADAQGRGDRALAEIAARQGFDGPPRRGTPADLDAAVHAGGTRIWRGIGGEHAGGYAAQFTSGGLYHAGFGIYGNGIYFSVRRDIAETSYAEGGGVTGGGLGGTPTEGPGVLIEAVIPAGAKMGTYGDLYNQMWDEVHGLYEGGGLGEDAQRVFDDVGRYAAAKGYDGYTVDTGVGSASLATEVVILNRGALLVREGQ